MKLAIERDFNTPFWIKEYPDANLLILLDYGIPPSAIKKLSKTITENLTINDLISKLKTINLRESGLLSYEVEKVSFLINS